eukprot:697795-Rhodomonas_salina.2
MVGPDIACIFIHVSVFAYRYMEMHLYLASHGVEGRDKGEVMPAGSTIPLVSTGHRVASP